MTDDEPAPREPPRDELADLMCAFRRAGRDVSPLLLDWVVELELERAAASCPSWGGDPI